MAISKTLRFEILKRDRFKCRHCGRAAPGVILNVDHVIPASKGGEDATSNLVAACWDCNQGKSDRELTDNSALERVRQDEVADALAEFESITKEHALVAVRALWLDIYDSDKLYGKYHVIRIVRHRWPRESAASRALVERMYATGLFDAEEEIRWAVSASDWAGWARETEKSVARYEWELKYTTEEIPREEYLRGLERLDA